MGLANFHISTYFSMRSEPGALATGLKFPALTPGRVETRSLPLPVLTSGNPCNLWMFGNVINYQAVTDQLLKWRSEFPILDKTVYLISHSLGAMPRATYDRLHDYAEAWATR